MISPDTLQRLSDAADVRRAPFAVAGACAARLDRDPRDLQALRQYIRVLAALGLGVAARRTFALLGSAAEGSAEIAALLEQVQAGVIPWSSRRRRFQANLRALETSGISARELVAAWEDPTLHNTERYELHQAADGNFFVADVGSAPDSPPPPWKAWLGGGLQDFKGSTASITRESFTRQVSGPLAFDGLGYGWFIPHVLQASERSYFTYSPPIYLVEPDLMAWCMILHLHDLQLQVASGRLRMFVGQGAAERFAQSLREHVDWSLPSSVVVHALRPRPPLDLRRLAERAGATRVEHYRQTAERIAAHYASFDGVAWRRRFAEAAAGGLPLRILGITTRYSTVLRYSMEELRTAAQAGPVPGVNLQMEICMEPDDQSLEKDYLGMIDRFKPDLLVTISRLRHEIPDLPRNIPALCWDQDNLSCMRDPAVLADLKGLTFVAGHGAVFGAINLNWPRDACIFCHPAGMTHRYSPTPATAEEIARFGSDASYVSHASGLPEELRANLRIKWVGGAKDFLPLFDAGSEEIVAMARRGQLLEYREIRDLILRIADSLKLPAPPSVVQELYVDLRLQVDRAFRHQTLEWVSHWCQTRNKRLRIWGNGWDNHPTLAKWAAGPALPGEQTQAVYRASRVNLQIIETGILHSRLLDGWAAGGFFLTRQAHRDQDAKLIVDLYRIGQLTQQEGIDTIGQLETRGSAELQRLWSTVVPLYPDADKTRIFAEFRIWRSLAPAQILIPGLDRIMFNSATEFERLADEYCAADERRQALSAGIRDVLQNQLSYDARWREFLRHISSNLGYAGTRSADAAVLESVR